MRRDAPHPEAWVPAASEIKSEGQPGEDRAEARKARPRRRASLARYKTLGQERSPTPADMDPDTVVGEGRHCPERGGEGHGENPSNLDNETLPAPSPAPSRKGWKHVALH